MHEVKTAYPSTFTKLFRTILLGVGLMLANLSYANPPGEPAPEVAPSFNPGDPGNDPDVPIDGGIIWLLASGLGYGLYHLKQKQSSH